MANLAIFLGALNMRPLDHQHMQTVSTAVQQRVTEGLEVAWLPFQKQIWGEMTPIMNAIRPLIENYIEGMVKYTNGIKI